MACLFGHKWDGCKCIKCGKLRNENHDWNLCAGKCKKCGRSCNVEHDWEGCKCKNCGEKDTSFKAQHNFLSISGKCVNVCSVCGKEDASYNAQHTYQLIPGKCEEECTVCGETQKIKHSYNNGKCTRCGTDINASGDNGIPPLIWAALEGNVKEVKALLIGGADVNICNDETPLMVAAKKGYDSEHIEIVKLLLSHGANVNATDLYGSSALRLAQRKGLTKMVDLLAAHGGKYLGA